MKWYLKVWKQYANFKGRARRKEFWMFNLFNIIIGYVLQFVMIIEAAIRALAYNDESVPVGAIVFLIYSLAVVIPSLAVNVRRLHDIGKSGWYYFIWLIPPFIVGAIILFVWYCKDSQPGENKYGANPKECLEQQQWN